MSSNISPSPPRPPPAPGLSHADRKAATSPSRLNARLIELQKSGDVATAATIVDAYVKSKQTHREDRVTTADALRAKKISPEQLSWLNAPSARFDRAFNGFDVKHQLHKLFIDKVDNARGPLLYDVDEPGYHAGMTAAFDLVRNTVGQPLTVDAYIALHDTAVTNVAAVVKRNPLGPPQPFSKGLGDGQQFYGLELFKVSEEARAEWHSDKLIYFCADDDTHQGRFGFRAVLLPDFEWIRHQIYSDDSQVRGVKEGDTLDHEARDRQAIQGILRDYEGSIHSARSPDDKLRAMATACRALEVSHFFADGNQRTVAFLVLNKMLIENGFSPAILDDPYLFDGYRSIHELVLDIKAGMENFKRELPA